MTTVRYQIAKHLDVYSVVEKAEKIAARAAKKGLAGGYAVSIDTEEATVVNEFTGLPQTIVVKYLVIDGEPVKYAGWTFVALAEFVNGDSVVTGSPYYEGPQVDRATLTGECDHCHTVRSRTKYIVVENEAGERKVVGSSCVKDFLGHEVTLAFFADPFAEFEDDALSFGGAGRVYDRVDSTLVLAACIIRQAGFVKSGSDYPTSTKQHVENYTASGLIGIETRKQFGSPTDEDRATAQAAFAFGQAMTGTSDYVLNLQAVLKGEYFAPKHLGLVVSLVGVYEREQAKAREESAAPVVTEAGYADEKTKVNLRVTVTRTREVESFSQSYYGPTNYDTVYTFVTVDAPHYRFEWRNTGAFAGIEVGDVVDLRGTVKNVNTWTNDKGRTFVTTRLTRCKVAPVEVAA